jgi:predicted SnoaL-like aldol condensation-catalyzing enzyme
MSIEENKALIRRFYEEISKGNLAVVDELVAADLVEHSPFVPGQAPGRQGTSELFTMIHAAFPDLRITAEFMGIAPTGKQITVGVIEIARIAGGKMAEHWNVVDNLGMMQQLGVIPPQEQSRK